MKAIILNGPPESGKDTLADHLVFSASGIRNAEKREFKTKLFEIAASLAGITMNHMVLLNNQETKNIPSPELPGGKSPRQWLIFVSEVVVKPHLGLRYFGQAAAKTLVNTNAVYVFSDGGFDEEAVEIVRKVGKENLLVLRLSRPDKTFAGDSRRYLDPNTAGATIAVKNTKDQETFLHEATLKVSKWLNS